MPFIRNSIQQRRRRCYQYGPSPRYPHPLKEFAEKDGQSGVEQDMRQVFYYPWGMLDNIRGIPVVGNGGDREN